jgi:hypothetical protein
MLARVVAIGVPACLIFAISANAYVREKTVMAFVQFIGSMFLFVVIFAHAAEAFTLFPSMGWGRTATLGHYIDLASTIASAILLPVGYFGRRLTWHKISN